MAARCQPRECPSLFHPCGPGSSCICDFIAHPLPVAHSSAASPAFCSAAIKLVSILPQCPCPISLPRELSPKSSDGCFWLTQVLAVQRGLPRLCHRSSLSYPYSITLFSFLFFKSLCHFPKSSYSVMIPLCLYLASSSSCVLSQVVRLIKAGPLLPHSLLPPSTVNSNFNIASLQ